MDCVSTIVAAIVDGEAASAIASLCGIGQVLVSQPAKLQLQSGPPIHELMYLDGLRVPDAGASYGATLTANPALPLISRIQPISLIKPRIGLLRSLSMRPFEEWSD